MKKSKIKHKRRKGTKAWSKDISNQVQQANDRKKLKKMYDGWSFHEDIGESHGPNDWHGFDVNNDDKEEDI
jgi:hypothetical protein